jgi:AcrR family transcriptional regulator
VANQRERILGGVAFCCERTGYRDMSVDQITRRAGVSRRTFYDLFENKEDAFLAACDQVVAGLLADVAEANSDARDFGDTAVGGLEVLFDMATTEPALARMVLVDVMAAGTEAARRRNLVVDNFAALVNHYAREHLPNPPPLVAAEMVVGGVYEVLFRRVVSGSVGELHALLPDLTFAALLPYIGLDEAEQVRERARTRQIARRSPGGV